MRYRGGCQSKPDYFQDNEQNPIHDRGASLRAFRLPPADLDCEIAQLLNQVIYGWQSAPSWATTISALATAKARNSAFAQRVFAS